MSQRIRIVLGVVVCFTGLLLAWRALHQADTPAIVAQAILPEVELAFSKSADLLITATEENTSALLSRSRDNSLARVDIGLLPAVAQTASARLDLASAFQAQLAGFLTGDFDSSLEDMVSRGWPRPSEDRARKDKEKRKTQHDRMAMIQIDPESVTARQINPDGVSNPRIEPLEGFGRSCFQTTPSDADGKKLSRFTRPVEGVIEVRIRVKLPDIHGVPTDAFLGYRFTWDPEFGSWRWVQTCVYRRPGSGPIEHLSPV